jgi:hypothetical protein
MGMAAGVADKKLRDSDFEKTTHWSALGRIGAILGF